MYNQQCQKLRLSNFSRYGWYFNNKKLGWKRPTRYSVSPNRHTLEEMFLFLHLEGRSFGIRYHAKAGPGQEVAQGRNWGGETSTRNAPIRGCSNLADFFSFFVCYHVPYHRKLSQGILKNKKPSLPSIFRRQYYSKEHPLDYYKKFLPCQVTKWGTIVCLEY